MPETTDTMPSTKIDLVPLDGGLLTSFANRGLTRGPDGRPYPESVVLAVSESPFTSQWKATRSLAKALLDLDDAWRNETGRRVRLTSVWRDANLQASLHAKYQRWVNAGRPAPGTLSYDSNSMSTAYACAPGESNHQWGASVDFDVEAMCIDNNGLAAFWEIAEPFGWHPIIAHPTLDQSECWHFDRRGPLNDVHALFAEDPASHGYAYTFTAQAGCILAGTYSPSGDMMARYVQARALLGGIYVGAPDGIIGPHSVAALSQALGTDVSSLPAAAIVSLMDERKVAFDAFAAL